MKPQQTSTTPTPRTRPVHIEVIMPLPEGWGICLSCEMLMARAQMDKAPYERGLDEYPPEWKEDFQRFSTLIENLSFRYGDDVLIRIFDPRSVQGLWKSLRYGVRSYPTFIFEKSEKICGWDEGALAQAIQAWRVQREVLTS